MVLAHLQQKVVLVNGCIYNNYCSISCFNSATPEQKSTIEFGLVAPIVSEDTKGLYTNPVIYNADSAYRKSATVLEGILAKPTSDVKAKLESFKSTLMSIW